MIGVPCGEEIVTIRKAVSIRYRNVSDRRTDRIVISISAYVSTLRNIKVRKKSKKHTVSRCNQFQLHQEQI